MNCISRTQFKYLKPYIKNNLNGIEIINGVPKVVYICWFGHTKGFTPEFTVRRFNAIVNLIESIKVPVILLTWDNYKSFDIPSYPMDPGFEYLSGNHKSDYLRAYMLYHYGGGYHDIKYRELSWENEWDKFLDPNIWMIGRRELKSDNIGFSNGDEWVQQEYRKLVTMGWVISRPKTEYIKVLLENITKKLKEKSDALQNNPAIQSRQVHQVCDDKDTYLYPFRYLELMGEMSHRLQLDYTNHINYTLPDILYKTYK
jgi:hypothetical protein